MILGILDAEGGGARYGEELSRTAAGMVPQGRSPQPSVWSNRHLAVCWVPERINTLDEHPQPFFSCDNTVAVMNQGKIHNVGEIKGWLGPDCRFRTGCSGEVLAHLYEKSQDGFLDRVNGKFAFALWDGRNEKLLLGRDHFGVEPVFYFRDGTRLIFSSSLRAILATGWVDKQLDHEAVLQYLLYCYNPGSATFFRGIHSLPPGHILSASGSTVSIRRYWRLSFAEADGKTADQYCDEIPDRIQNAIRIRLEPECPPGIFLSGGTDSSTVATLSSRLSREPIRTFSFRCAGRSYDESRYSRFMAQHLGAQHTEIPYGPEQLPLISKAVEWMDEPFCDIGIEIATFLLGGAAGGSVGYVLSGEGGDELFGGHPVYVADKLAAVMDLFPRTLVKPLAERLARIPDSSEKSDIQVKIKRFAYSLSFPPELLSHRWRVYYQPGELRQLCTGHFLDSCDLGRMFESVLQHNADADGRDLLSRSLYSDLQTLVGFYLKRLGLLRAFSLESRLPLLDRGLVEYAATIPSRLKVRGLSRTKFMYRRALQSVLPPEILHGRPKLGHGVPMKSWLREDPNTIRWISDTLCDRSSLARGFFRSEFVQQMVKEHVSKTNNHSHRLWALLVLELWLRTSLGR